MTIDARNMFNLVWLTLTFYVIMWPFPFCGQKNASCGIVRLFKNADRLYFFHVNSKFKTLDRHQECSVAFWILVSEPVNIIMYHRFPSTTYLKL